MRTCSGVHLVLVARALAVLGEALHGLVDESHVLLVDVEPQQTQASCGAAADAVEELQRLAHQVIIVLVVLTAQEVLQRQIKRDRGGEDHSSVENVSTGYKRMRAGTRDGSAQGIQGEQPRRLEFTSAVGTFHI